MYRLDYIGRGKEMVELRQSGRQRNRRNLGIIFVLM